jgi:putative addiction module killer protein
MLEIRETPAYAAWFAALRDRTARARIDIRIRRLSLGNSGDIRPVGDGVSELRIHYGPGYRIYLTKEPLGNEPSKRVQACDLLGMSNFWGI